ncbi:hypothetical protein D9M70_594040 [compost metagenome]
MPDNSKGDNHFISVGKGPDGYKLKEGSAAIKAGRVISANGGKDFFGNTVSEEVQPNVGAFNGMAL